MLNIVIITPEKKLFEGVAERVVVPSVDGSFEVLTNHAPVVAALAQGEISLTTAERQTTKISISGGFVEVLNNNISLVVTA